MADERKPYDNLTERRVSMALGAGLAIYDAYAQAHGIHYTMPAWVYGIVLYPYGEATYDWAKDVVKALPGIVLDRIPRLPKK
ncbi:MAG TPA: hypothetical protein V6D22_16830 [Candidatus Obscuribacterales bacterium]